MLPTSGSVAWLDLDFPADELSSLRILDQDHRQVPYVMESGSRQRTAVAAITTSIQGVHTLVKLTGLKSWPRLSAIELGANAPEYFERELRVRELAVDQRGPAGSREIGSARWSKAPGQPFTPLRIPISAPEQDTIEVEIDNGDNAPLVVTSAAVIWEVRRLDFVFEPSDRLALVSGNAGLGSPRYDLALVAGRVLSAPAGAAKLGKVAERSAAAPKVPGWFWGFVVAAAALVVVALARTLRADRKSA